MTDVKVAGPRPSLAPPAPFSFPSPKTSGATAWVPGDRARWTNRYRRILLASDLASVTLAVAVAHLARFGVAPEFMSGGGPSVNISYLVVSTGIWAAWMLALAVYRTRDPKIIGAGMDEYNRVVSSTVIVMGLIAMFCLAFQVDISRAYFAHAVCLMVVSSKIKKKVNKI